MLPMVPPGSSVASDRPSIPARTGDVIVSVLLYWAGLTLALIGADLSQIIFLILSPLFLLASMLLIFLRSRLEQSR